MTYESEDRLVAVLRQRAEVEVDAEALLAGALAGGRGRRRKFRIGLASGAVAAGTALVLAAAPLGLGPGLAGGFGPSWSDPTPHPSEAVRGAYTLPSIPAAPDTPGAAARPDVVGTDVMTIHFGMSTVPWPTSPPRWAVVGGIEQVFFSMLRGAVLIRVSQDSLPAPDGLIPEGPFDTSPLPSGPPSPATAERTVRIGDHDATLTTISYGRLDEHHSVRWQAGGVHVRVDTYWIDEIDVLEVARAVRLQSAARCALPIVIGVVPTGMAVAGCEVYLTGASEPGQAVFEGTLTLAGTSSNRVYVRAFGLHEPGAAASGMPYRAGGLTTPNPSAERLVLPGTDGMTVEVSGSGTGLQASYEVRTVADAIRRAGDLAKPETWPLSPVG